jgi:hypothetical protein
VSASGVNYRPGCAGALRYLLPTETWEGGRRPIFGSWPNPRHASDPARASQASNLQLG